MDKDLYNTESVNYYQMGNIQNTIENMNSNILLLQK